ncbi:hypothetical protein HK096_008402, partial [Nowakowskiella sp. JEL0078]
MKVINIPTPAPPIFSKKLRNMELLTMADIQIRKTREREERERKAKIAEKEKKKLEKKRLAEVKSNMFNEENDDNEENLENQLDSKTDLIDDIQKILGPQWTGSEIQHNGYADLFDESNFVEVNSQKLSVDNVYEDRQAMEKILSRNHSSLSLEDNIDESESENFEEHNLKLHDNVFCEEGNQTSEIEKQNLCENILSKFHSNIPSQVAITTEPIQESSQTSPDGTVRQFLQTRLKVYKSKKAQENKLRLAMEFQDEEFGESTDKELLDIISDSLAVQSQSEELSSQMDIISILSGEFPPTPLSIEATLPLEEILEESPSKFFSPTLQPSPIESFFNYSQPTPNMEKFANTKMKQTSMYIEQEAHESDDEFKGLGGVDGEDEDSSNDSELENSADEEVIENFNKVVELHRIQMQKQDESDISALIKDVTTGKLRKRIMKRNASSSNGFGLSDSDDDEWILKKIKMRGFWSNRSNSDDHEGMGKYANHPETAAFASCFESQCDDRVGFIEDEVNNGQEADSVDDSVKVRRSVSIYATLSRQQSGIVRFGSQRNLSIPSNESLAFEKTQIRNEICNSEEEGESDCLVNYQSEK